MFDHSLSIFSFKNPGMFLLLKNTIPEDPKLSLTLIPYLCFLSFLNSKCIVVETHNSQFLHFGDSMNFFFKLSLYGGFIKLACK